MVPDKLAGTVPQQRAPVVCIARLAAARSSAEVVVASAAIARCTVCGLTGLYHLCGATPGGGGGLGPVGAAGGGTGGAGFVAGAGGMVFGAGGGNSFGGVWFGMALVGESLAAGAG